MPSAWVTVLAISSRWLWQSGDLDTGCGFIGRCIPIAPAGWFVEAAFLHPTRKWMLRSVDFS